MEPQETIAFTDWLAKIDPRVMYEEGAREVWHHALKNTNVRAAKAAAMEHFRLYPTAPKPSEIATRARQLVASYTAKQRALTAAPAKPADTIPLRKRDPQRWQQLIEHGKQQRETTMKERAS
jgi:hypothetical protein